MEQDVKHFKGGNLHLHYPAWENITSDKYILGIIRHGLLLDFNSIPGTNVPIEHPVSCHEQNIIDNEIAKLLQKGVVVRSTFEEGNYCSGDFTRPKKDGSWRMILNLKKLNTHNGI